MVPATKPSLFADSCKARTEEYQRNFLDEAVSEASGSDTDDGRSNGDEMGSGAAQQASGSDDFIECSSGSERSFCASGGRGAKRARTVGESAAASAGPGHLAGGAQAGSQLRARGSTLHAYFEPLPLGPPHRSFALPSIAELPLSSALVHGLHAWIYACCPACIHRALHALIVGTSGASAATTGRHPQYSTVSCLKQWIRLPCQTSQKSSSPLTDVCLAGEPPPEAAAALQPTRPAAADPFAPAQPEERSLSELDFANRRVFGNAAFRPQQREVIEAVLQQRDCFVLMPTGGGAPSCQTSVAQQDFLQGSRHSPCRPPTLWRFSHTL